MVYDLKGKTTRVSFNSQPITSIYDVTIQSATKSALTADVWSSPSEHSLKKDHAVHTVTLSLNDEFEQAQNGIDFFYSHLELINLTVVSGDLTFNFYGGAVLEIEVKSAKTALKLAFVKIVFSEMTLTRSTSDE